MKLTKLLNTKVPVIGYIGNTGQSFRILPYHAFLTPLSDNPELTPETITILIEKLEKGI